MEVGANESWMSCGDVAGDVAESGEVGGDPAVVDRRSAVVMVMRVSCRVDAINGVCELCELCVMVS